MEPYVTTVEPPFDRGHLALKRGTKARLRRLEVLVDLLTVPVDQRRRHVHLRAAIDLDRLAGADADHLRHLEPARQVGRQQQQEFVGNARRETDHQACRGHEVLAKAGILHLPSPSLIPIKSVPPG